MLFARDTFVLYWAPAESEEDPCSLRDLRGAESAVLCVGYCGKGGTRMRPSDVVRGELQLRRRLLEQLAVAAPEEPLPLCELPAKDNAAPPPPLRRPRAAVATSRTGTPQEVEVGAELIEALKQEPWYKGQVAHVERIEPRGARLAVPKAELEPHLQAALAELVGGAAASLRLYSHQAEALDAVAVNGRDVVVSTSTGSGKSLVYLAAVFNSLLQAPEATALLVFPTKALAQDQLQKLGSLMNALVSRGVPREALTCACLDGDTPPRERGRVRDSARVVLTNPDMLHVHVLPRHKEYRRLLGALTYVVLDEVHVYRGAFGMHVACILRRLRRLSTSPRFIGCSATVANPGEHFARLIGPRSEEPVVVAEDGAPSGARLVVLWNPQLLSPAKGALADDVVLQEDTPAAQEPYDDGLGPPAPLEPLRHSPIVEVTRLLAWLVERDISALAFCKWRSLVEIVMQDVREALSSQPELAARVASYRAGYPAALRRDLERQIFTRELLAVACTNALELGVDIGRLDCTISLGFPGSVASLRQQFGRAGRGGRAGLSFFVAWEDATDQHLMRTPERLLARRAEAVALAAENVVAVCAHLPLAAAEQPLLPSDASLWPGTWECAVQRCLTQGLLESRSDGTLVSHGSQRVSIRSVDVRYQVVAERAEPARLLGGFERAEESRREVIDEVDESKAFYTLFPGSVYRLRGEEYLIVDLDLHRRRATARRCETPLAYYTRVRDATTFRLLTQEERRHEGGAVICTGEVEMETRVVAFRRHWKAEDAPQEAEVELDLPSWGLRSRGLWFEPVSSVPGLTWAGMHSAEHVLAKVFPLFVLAERTDLEVCCVGQYGAPPMEQMRLILVDAQQGGLGLCDEALASAHAMIREARRLVEGCGCEDGCPACIVDAHCKDYNRLLSKREGLAWLRALEGEDSGEVGDG